MNSVSRGTYVLSSLTLIAFLVILPTSAKVWSIDERQLQLMQDINQGQKLKQLTDKEAKKLREQLSDIARKKKKFQKGDTTSKAFTDAQKTELGADLDKVRADLKKVEAEKLETKDSSSGPKTGFKKVVQKSLKKLQK